MARWIIVVDDDIMNLKMAGQLLSKNNYRVTALKSGELLLDYVRENVPDLILLDIMMPGMDGFETLGRLRKLEAELHRAEVPVIFMTADEDFGTESRSFEVGVSDFIRKPFDTDVLLKRIDNTLNKQEKLKQFRTEAMTDTLTGLLNKNAANEKMEFLCREKSGCLMIVDLDSFKLVNDLYGHKAGDELLIRFSELLKQYAKPSSTIGRIGGDEFLMFSEGITEPEINTFTLRLNEELVLAAKQIMGENMGIPLGASVGAVSVPESGTDYVELFELADKALYHVKQNGKHGYAMGREESYGDTDEADEISLKRLSAIFDERNIPGNALWLEQDAFVFVYRFVMRYIKRYRKKACKILFTLEPASDLDKDRQVEYIQKFGGHVQNTLRKSDILTQTRKNQYLVFLTDMKEAHIAQVLGGILSPWYRENAGVLGISYEVEFVTFRAPVPKTNGEIHVTVVDDDEMNLKMASRILTEDHIYVTALKSGREFLEHVRYNKPDLILLDVNMPDMDGFETMQKLRLSEDSTTEIPVIFLTADDNAGTESKCLALGAMDFIRKPFVPEVLTLRVRQTVELTRLQKNLEREVHRKTQENERLFLHVVQSLADAIDAKDTYTNGHSGRVAEYSREIARRYGYSEKQQNDIYIMGLLHDVGKIGIPDAVINKPGRLTEEEFALIKTHPVMGDKILKNIKEMPKLATGAKWHHERYGGGGYPDGLKGEEIPEEARIIAVADAYDAMTSRRSYRDSLPQEVVREEIRKGRGTQFDPGFADIMLKMIEEDTEYTMREQ